MKTPALLTKFDALSQRERNLVAVAVLGGAALIGWASMVDPARSRLVLAERSLAEQRSQVVTLRGQIVMLQSNELTPEARGRAELADLKKQLKALHERYNALGGSLVPPQRMAGLLGDMIGSTEGLRLLSLRTLPVGSALETKESGPGAATKTGIAGAAAGVANSAGAPVGLFKHGVEVKLEGGYAALAEYLARLEKSPQKLLWGSVALSAENHPKLLLTLTVYTLSVDRTWLIL